MKRIIAAIAVCCVPVGFANAQDFEDSIVGRVTDEFITITNVGGEDVGMWGLDVQSFSGGLKANGAAPFDIVLLDTPNNVVVGNLGKPFVLGTGATARTEIGFAGSVSDLAGTWGLSGGIPCCRITFVPEPASGLMASVAAFALLGFRRRSLGPFRLAEALIESLKISNLDAIRNTA